MKKSLNMTKNRRLSILPPITHNKKSTSKRSASKSSLSTETESMSQMDLTKSELAILDTGTAELPVIDEKHALLAKPSASKKKVKGSLFWQQLQDVSFPKLNKKELDKRSCNPKHNVCIELLKDGFPQAFIDMFQVFLDFNDYTKHKKVLENYKLDMDRDKLEYLAKYLSKAEDAERKGQWIPMYQAKKNLANYFHSHGDDWLAQHFYHDCLKTAKRIDTDDGRRLAEANGYMGMFYESRGNLDKALEHFQIMHQMTDGTSWLNINYKSMHTEASYYVAKIYSIMADSKLEIGETPEALELYLNALEMTSKANDKLMMINVYKKLGHMYKNNNDLEESLSYFQQLEKICKEIGEFHSLCDTYEAIAQVYTCLDQQEQAKYYLKKFAYTAERHNLGEALIKASFLLGKIMSVNQQNYDAAWTNFIKSFMVSQRLGHTKLGDKVRVHSGVALSHSLWSQYTKLVKSNYSIDLYSLVEWKLFPIPIKLKPQKPRRMSLRTSSQIG